MRRAAVNPAAGDVTGGSFGTDRALRITAFGDIREPRALPGGNERAIKGPVRNHPEPRRRILARGYAEGTW